MSAAGPVLLVLTLALPLALALLALVPFERTTLLRTLPFAALPGLGAALITPRDEIVRLPDLLLGIGLSINQLDAVFLGFSSLIWALAGVYACRYITASEKAAAFAGFWLLTLAGNLGVFIETWESEEHLAVHGGVLAASPHLQKIAPFIDPDVPPYPVEVYEKGY